MQPKVWNRLPVPASARQGQGGSSIPSHALVVLRTVTGSPWMAKERRCAEQFSCEGLDLYWKAEIAYSPDMAWGSLKLLLTPTFLFYPNYPGFVVYLHHLCFVVLGLAVGLGVGFSCALRNIHLLQYLLSCSTLGLRGRAPGTESLAKVDELNPCLAQHPVSFTACAGFLTRV